MTPGGYAWWYVDALSDDGRHGLSVIAFIGSVFSPYYHWAGRRDPENHCAVNVALYGPGANRWTMTERGRASLARDATSLAIGPSSLRWDGQALVLDIAEIAVPWPRAVRGRIRLEPTGLAARSYALDGQARHRWMPVAPSARVEVGLTSPDCRWSGHGYWDTNEGDEPIARAFSTWSWSRAELRQGSALLYDVVGRDGGERSIAVRYTRDGRSEDFPPPPRTRLKRTRWGLDRITQADSGYPVRVRRTLEDGPFYARSELQTCLLGEEAPAVHESMSCDRFDTAWVRLLLPWRMPRRFV